MCLKLNLIIIKLFCFNLQVNILRKEIFLFLNLISNLNSRRLFDEYAVLVPLDGRLGLADHLTSKAHIMSFQNIDVFEQLDEIRQILSYRLGFNIETTFALRLPVSIFQNCSIFSRITQLTFVYVEAIFVILLHRRDDDSFVLLDLQIVLVPYYLK